MPPKVSDRVPEDGTGSSRFDVEPMGDLFKRMRFVISPHHHLPLSLRQVPDPLPQRSQHHRFILGLNPPLYRIFPDIAHLKPLLLPVLPAHFQLLLSLSPSPKASSVGIGGNAEHANEVSVEVDASLRIVGVDKVVEAA